METTACIQHDEIIALFSAPLSPRARRYAPHRLETHRPDRRDARRRPDPARDSPTGRRLQADADRPQPADTRFPCLLKNRASLPQVVVFPAPWNPTIITTVGGLEARAEARPFAAHHLAKFIPHDLDDLMTRGQTLKDFLTNGLLADPLNEVLDDLKLTSASAAPANLLQAPPRCSVP